MCVTDYGQLYDEYWGRADRWGTDSFTDAETLADEVLALCGGGPLLDVGCGMGRLTLLLLRRGVDARGVDVAVRPIEHLARVAPGRFATGSVLQLPFADGAFETVVCTDVLEHLDEVDVPRALAELRRVTRRSVYLTIATLPDRDGRWHLTVRPREWWENAVLAAGLRRHPLTQRVWPYDSLERDCPVIVLGLERIPDPALARYPLEALQPERDLHMDMLREAGRRSDAHVARYQLASIYVRPGDVVLDVACGLGYGSSVLAANSPARRVIGVDCSATAVEYARANYGGDAVEFHQADAASLGFLPDQSVDLVASFETLEHVPDPRALLTELRRVLRPSGHLLVSVPNEWRDETGVDPNPHHLHVYDRTRLRDELAEFFLVERWYAQTAGGGLKHGDQPRRMREVPVEGQVEVPAEWWVALGMKDPVGCSRVGYAETSFPDHTSLPHYNITAFARDYDNPWLVKGLVSIGMRMTNVRELEQMAGRVLADARPGSADVGAALCVQCYQLLDHPELSAARADELLAAIERFHAEADDTPNAWRWRISNQYVGGLLLLATGRREEARAAFLSCAEMDCLRFSPLLATKTVDALFRAGLLAVGSGDYAAAAVDWRRALDAARRVLSGDWTNIWGTPEQPVEFGLPEATQILDSATRCSYGLVALRYWADRPGYGWSQAFRNTERALRDALGMARHQRGYLGQLEAERQKWIQIAEDRHHAIAGLHTRLAARDGEFREKSAEADRIWAALLREQETTANLGSQVERSTRELARVTAQHADLEYRLNEIFSSTGWRVLQGLYRIRFGLFPRGSRRERIGRWLMHQQRAVRARWRSDRRAMPAPPLSAAPARRATPPAGPADVTGVPGHVSIILPVYNQADLLAESIESVLAQTYQDFELVVVNDGSKDDVERVLARYAGHPRIRLLTQANQKLPKALSNGFTFARGEFWTWTSADNVMEPRQLEQQVNFLRAHPEAHMVYCDYLAIDDRGAPLRDPSFRPQNRRGPDDPEIHIPRHTNELNTQQDNFIGACFMYRGWTGRVLGDYAPNLGVEDYDYWMRMNSLFAIRHIGTDEVLYRYRVHDNTLNARAAEHRILERVQRLLRHDVERRAFYARPWTIWADAPTRAWLQRIDTTPHTVCETLPAPGAGDAKLLRLVRGDTLRTLPAAAAESGSAILAWFAADPRQAHEAGPDVQRLGAGCIAPDRATRARLELYTDSVWQGQPGAELLNVATARANNAVFYNNTTPAGDAARALPRVFRPADRPLRVLLQVNDFVQGGLEQVVIDLAATLNAAGIETRIAVLGRQGAAVADARRRNVNLEHLPGIDPETYRRYLSEQGFHAVSAHYSLFGAEVAAELGIPFVQTIHNSYVWLDDAARAAHRAADPHTTAYCCVSGNAAQYADLALGLNCERMLIVPNGVDTAALAAAAQMPDRAAARRELGFDDHDFVYLNVASIYPPKGQHLLLQALRIAREKNRRIKVAFLGRPMEESYAVHVREQAERDGLTDAVRWLGYQPDPQRFYYLCDGFALPSFIEGWSLALAEALYAGLPIVATEVGGAREVLGGSRHFLVPAQYASVVDVDLPNWCRLLSARHSEVVDRLAAALVAGADCARVQPTPEAGRRLDRHWAYQGYARLFEWLTAGGVPAAARPWTWALHRPNVPFAQL